MVALAAAFRLCKRARVAYQPVVIPVQLLLLLVWAPTRLLFLVLESATRSAYRADMHLRQRWAEAD